MKRIALPVILLLCLMLTACGETAELDRAVLETNENNSIEESEQISTRISGVVTDSSNLDFPLGMEVNSDSFTGTVYMNSMIANDDIYNFPDTSGSTVFPMRNILH